MLNDAIYNAYWLANLCEEESHRELDEKGRIDIEQRSVYGGTAVLSPAIDLMASKIASVLQPVRSELARWPEGKEYCIAVSHDVDKLYEAESIVGALVQIGKSIRWRYLDLSFLHTLTNAVLNGGKIRSWISHNIEHILNFEIAMGAQSTWFFYAAPWSGYRYDLFYDVKIQIHIRRIIKMILAEGNEIGLHTSIMSAFDDTRIVKEKNYLAKVLRRKICGTRQHELAGKGKERTLAISENGFNYDSSIGFNHSAGFRSGISVPYTPYDSRDEDFLELPLSMLDNALASTAEQNGIAMLDAGLSLLEEARKCKGMLVLDWHPHVWDNPKYPGWGSVYEKLLETAKGTGAWIANAGMVGEWWLAKRKHYRPSDSFKLRCIDEAISIT